MSEQENITRLLTDLETGREGAIDELMEAVYTDLQHVAERHMRQQFGRNLAGVTMEPAGLVNESFLRLIRQRKAYGNRGQFFAIATKVMLRVLTDYQRQRLALKRGGGRQRVTLSIEPALPPAAQTRHSVIGVEALSTALQKLDDLDSRKADVVRLRVVWGLQMQEVAESLGTSLSTVERDWAFAKAWLAREAADDDSAQGA